VLTDGVALEQFERFVGSAWAAENLLFHRRVEKFRRLKESEYLEEAKAMFDEFLGPGLTPFLCFVMFCFLSFLFFLLLSSSFSSFFHFFFFSFFFLFLSFFSFFSSPCSSSLTSVLVFLCCPDAAMEINLDMELSEAIREKIDSNEISFDLWDKAETHCLNLLRYSVFPLWKSSPGFKDFLKKQKVNDLQEFRMIRAGVAGKELLMEDPRGISANSLPTLELEGL